MDGHGGYGGERSNKDFENETCGEPTYVVEGWKKRLLDFLWCCGVSLIWAIGFVALCWLKDRLYPRSPRHWSEEAIREDRERRDEEARLTMEDYSMWDYQSFDDEEDYYEDWWNYRDDHYDDDSWSDSGYTSWEDRGW